MRKWILFLFLFYTPIVFAIDTQSGFDTGKLSANQITPDCTQWSNNLSCADSNQQLVDNVVDQLSSSGGGSWKITDGTNTVTGITQLTVTGATVGGSTPNATLTITGGSGSNYWALGNVGINTTNNVGIGSVNPGQTLDVNGTVRALQFDMGGSVLKDNSLAFSNNSNITNPQSFALVINSGTNLGIGSSLPSATLDVHGNTRTTSFQFASSVQPSSGDILKATASTGVAAWEHPSALPAPGSTSQVIYNLGGAYAASSNFVFDGTNVGIGGVSSPQYSLDVGNNGIGNSMSGTLTLYGTVQTSNNTLDSGGNMSVAGTITSGGVLTCLQNGTDCPSSGSGTVTSVGLSSTNSTLTIGSTPVTTSGTITGDINLAHTNNWTADQEFAGNVGIGTTKTTTAALTVMNGNVGIGTWVPGSILEGDSNVAQLKFNAGSGGSTPTLAVGNTGASGKFAALVAGTSGASFTYDGTGFFGMGPDAKSNYNTNNLGGSIPTAFYLSSTGNIGLGTSTSAGGLVVMNGNVGIGTWVPSDTLQIGNGTGPTKIDGASITLYGPLTLTGGNVTIAGNSTGGSTGLTLTGGAATSGNYVNIKTTSSNDSGAGDFVKITGGNNGGTEIARFLGTGNVGIGTTTPAGALTVMNGNVGIGTWVPNNSLVVNGGMTANNVTNNTAITASSNAATCPVTYKVCSVTNSSAATITVTLTTTGAVDGQIMLVRIYDYSGTAESITWTNTENSTVTAPTTTNGSTTLPISAGFEYNAATSKWRCVGTA